LGLGNFFGEKFWKKFLGQKCSGTSKTSGKKILRTKNFGLGLSIFLRKKSREGPYVRGHYREGKHPRGGWVPLGYIRAPTLAFTAGLRSMAITTSGHGILANAKNTNLLVSKIRGGQMKCHTGPINICCRARKGLSKREKIIHFRSSVCREKGGKRVEFFSYYPLGGPNAPTSFFHFLQDCLGVWSLHFRQTALAQNVREWSYGPFQIVQIRSLDNGNIGGLTPQGRGVALWYIRPLGPAISGRQVDLHYYFRFWNFGICQNPLFMGHFGGVLWTPYGVDRIPKHPTRISYHRLVVWNENWGYGYITVSCNCFETYPPPSGGQLSKIQGGQGKYRTTGKLKLAIELGKGYLEVKKNSTSGHPSARKRGRKFFLLPPLGGKRPSQFFLFFARSGRGMSPTFAPNGIGLECRWAEIWPFPDCA